MKKRTMFKAGLGFLIASAIHFGAKAETTYHNDEPASKITAKEFRDAKKGFRCYRGDVGNDGNPKKAKGAKMTFHSAVGEANKDALANLGGDKPVYICEEVLVNADTGRVNKVR